MGNNSPKNILGKTDTFVYLAIVVDSVFKLLVTGNLLVRNKIGP